VELDRVGVELADFLDLRERVELAAWLEANGYDHAYIAEITDPDAFVTLALAASATSRLRLGTCVVQIGPRSVPMIATGASAVSTIAPGRFELGIGVSTEVIVAGWHGLTWEKPLLRAREAVTTLRSVLSGQRTDGSGEQVRSKGFRLAYPPAEPPPIFLAGLNQGMLRLAGEVADGVWLSFVPAEGIPRVREVVRSGAESAGREEPELRLSILSQVTDDLQAARAEVREALTFYVSAPVYRKALSWHGFADEMAAAADAFAQRDRQGVRRAISDRMVDQLSLIGTASQVREHLEEFVASGLSTPTICPLNKEGRELTLRTLAPAALGVSE
jgi:probable F420-dependent oxidoreductase